MTLLITGVINNVTSGVKPALSVVQVTDLVLVPASRLSGIFDVEHTTMTNEPYLAFA
jgi:hypothetical protein